MEHETMPNDKIIGNLTDDELYKISLDQDPEIFNTIENVIKENPEFKEMTFIQLKNNKKFQKALKEYRIKNPLTIKPEVSDSIEMLHSIIPENFYITNNKLSNEMTKDFINKGNIELAVINSSQKGEIFTYNSLTYDNKNISITGQHEFTAYDRAIHNAVCSLYAAGNDVITPAMVYRTVNGMSENQKASPQAMESIVNSLDKSRFMRLKVDYSEEAKARDINIEKAEFDSYLLPAKKITVKAGGNEVDAYKIIEMPDLYKYSQQTKQIISIPLNVLDTKKAIRSSEEIITIKEYLIRRIEMMKHNKSLSNKIIYEVIFEEIGIANPDKKKSFALRATIKAIFELWKKKSYIQNYTEYKQSKSIKGIEITL